MSHYLATSVAESPILYVKVQSGRQIEEARKKRRLTQRDLARELGMGVRWLREIEAGNPRARLDDHLLCAYRLGLSTGHILIPLLFAGQRMNFPRQLATGDLSDLERMCIEMIAQQKLDHLTRALTPAWSVPAVCAGSGL
ncbi:helix-turn-helix domain-containing protein [Sphingobium scionense]|jgi:transcriptional regulator with XRE-family HTH domain|uniref:Helix-turn-helix domain-containing protein n=2 Tax=Sphingobium TaxID=165695 RepID=A0A6P1GDZ8_SPHYA|nr:MULTISPECIES: helix-turn-helix domain-containing protein [Sphingobium]MBB4151419.1 transcriptional regulator with XRE-family HTH domain [Sphingobium scionense]QHD66727.1 helix-turn-helix domain-containing protein [Sphingobium yanoikuyae]